MGRHKGFTMSDETKAKMSAARRARTDQPNPKRYDCNRTIMALADEWNRAMVKAKEEDGTTLSSKIRHWIKIYISQ